MKQILCVAVLITGATPVMAGEITVKVSDGDQQSFAALPGAVDQCVAGLQLRGDAAMCKAIVQFATEFGAKVKAAAPPAGVTNDGAGQPAVTVPAK
jgi:hypothetical protein